MHIIYEKAGFALFPCNLDKTPKVPSWRSTEYHITLDEADRVAAHGGYIGAWVPQNMVIIDLDKGHSNGVDGVKAFEELCKMHSITSDLTDTLTIKTGSSGLHLYFCLPDGIDYKELSQKSITTAVDVRTHLGYVIAAGTSGYTVVNDVPAKELPQALLNLIRTRTAEKAAAYDPDKKLPAETLKKILDKIDIQHFDTNDTWQEMVTACIATAGNASEVLDILEAWSRTDERYKDDTSIRKRIETFEPDGGITAGTFLHILKKEDISKYIIDRVRMLVGTQFNFSDSFADVFEPPFLVDYSRIHDHKEIMGAFYYTRHQASGVALFAELVRNSLIYSTNEKCFYYFDGNRWQETPGILDIIFTVLLQAGQRFYTDKSKKSDKDADDIIQSYIGFIGSLALTQKFESALKQHPVIAKKNMQWDSPDLEGTLTLADCVMDFTKRGEITFRKGKKEDYRRLYIDLHQDDFKDVGQPVKFKEFLRDAFPDTETRKTATYALSTMLSGTGKFRKLQIWNGAGSNGKSTLMELMKYVIGERAISYKADILLNKLHSASLTPELAVFRGALVAFASETEESKRVSQGAVKALTGNETMTANPKYQGMIEFKTTFQLVLSTNYLPTFSAHDAAFINRVLILPFYTAFYRTEEEMERAKARGARYFKPAKDAQVLEHAIRQERAEILHYLAKRYQELDNDIPESAECQESKKHYIDDNNDIIKFLHEFVEYQDSPAGKAWFVPTKDITEFYNQENNTKYSSKFVLMRLKEVYPLVETSSRMIHGKLTRGVRFIRLKYGAYPEGYTGNFTDEEREEYINKTREQEDY